MSRALRFLLNAQNADGGWGYRSAGMSFVEPTAAVLLALPIDGQSNATVQRAREWLKSLQQADGGWGIAALDDESGWMTAWAVRALAVMEPEAAARGQAWLLEQAGIRVAERGQIEEVKKVLQIDATITGWPWQPGDAAWIFPTSTALLGLNAPGLREHPRVREGIQYLLDRAIPAGGWNIGNPFMVSGTLPPTVENTALTLMALDAWNIASPITERARAWLSGENFTGSAFEWAWRAWYWATHGQDVTRARAALEKMQRADGSWDSNPFTTALVLLGRIDL